MSTPIAYVTAAQLAQAMGIDKSTVTRRAGAETWAYSEASGLGGSCRQYIVAQLPDAVRAHAQAWFARQGPSPDAPPELRAAAWAGRTEAARLTLGADMQSRVAGARQETALRQAGELRGSGQTRMDARLAAVRAFELFAAGQPGLPVAQARLLFALQYNAGSASVPAAVREVLPTLSDRSLKRWQSDIRTHGITALAGAYGNRAGSSKVSAQPELREFVQAMLVTHPHARASHVMRGLRARFAGSADLPSRQSLQRWMADWRADNAEVLQALADPDAWKNKYMVAQGSKSEIVQAINQLWERDSSPADVMCTDGRYTLIAGVDVFTRDAVLLVARTSKAVAVGAHLRAMLLAFGVPQVDKTDNGSDYTALYTERVYDGLDIKHELCPPFQPWHKPHVERFFGTFARDLVELLPGYIGHNVAERSAIEARKSFADRLMKRGQVVELRMTGAELQTFCDQWLATIYRHQPHAGLGQRTPFELRAAHAHQVRHIADERALDVLLAEAPGRDGRRTVQKKGIKLDAGWFIAPELEAWVGRDVQVRYDPIHHDLGTVYVFGGDESLGFICLAQNPERTGMDRREVAIKTKALQRDRVQAERRALRAAAKKVGVDQVMGEILRERATAAGKLTALPVRNVATHTSAGLVAGAQAAAAATAPQRTTAHLENLVEVRARQAQIAANNAGVPAAVSATVFESMHQRVRWTLEQSYTRSLSADEQVILDRYRAEKPEAFLRLRSQLAGEREIEQVLPTRRAGNSGPV